MMSGWHELDRLWGSMDLLRNRMNRLFGEYENPWVLLPAEREDNFPRINLYDQGDHFEIEAEIPGFTRDELKIKIQGNYLEMGGEKKEQAPKDYVCHRRERLATGFSRSLTLPADIDHDRVEAKLKHGILSLILPKAEAAKPRQITIN